MSSERWRRMEEIFQQVLDRPPGERERFLDRECGDDPTLRQAVASLLVADLEGKEFLEASPVAPPGADPATSPSGGDRIGSYRLLHPIGAGGMSTVFLAVRDDEAFQRRVAVKIIRRGAESELSLRRMRTERQILAGLDHPYIARLYDGGTTADGLPYFVMEYVEGQPIDSYCDRHRLPVGERLALFAKVCSAVSYAHRNLVVHRDIKPSNILVTADREPKLLDFGIAKLLNPELSSSEIEPTTIWLRVLTPHYASPEQIRGGPITTASDVYSLGVLLCKLLAGRLPHDLAGRSPQEVERILVEEVPPKPSTIIERVAGEGAAGEGAADEPKLETISRARGAHPAQLARQLAGDLDNIVLKAMHPVPERRYGSVEQLSEDLRRYAMGLPVLARPGDFSYRLGKFLRRRWAPVAASAGSLLLLLGFAVAMALQSARLARERDQVRRERDEKQEVLALVEDIFHLADPGEARGESYTVREALDRGAESIGRRLSGQPALEASLRHTIGTIYLKLGLLTEAESQLQQVLEIRRRLYGEESVAVADSLSALGAVFREQGEYDRAEAYAVGSVSRMRRLVGDDHPDLVRPINRLVSLRCSQGDYAAADQPSTDALALARKHLDPTHLELARAVTNRAVVVRNQGDLDTAERLYREGLELHRRIRGQEHPQVATILNNLAVVLKTRGDLVGAERTHREALALRRKLYGEDHPAVAQSLTNLGSVLRERGDFGSAEALYREAVVILRARLGASHPLTVDVAVTLAAAFTESDQASAAAGWLQEHLAVWRRELPPGDRSLAWAENTLGDTLTALGRYAEAEGLLRRTRERIRSEYGEAHARSRLADERLVTLYEAWGRPNEAARYRRTPPSEAGPATGSAK